MFWFCSAILLPGLTLGRIMFLEALEYTALVLLPVAIIAMGYLVFKATGFCTE